jgi:hypothetical protein
VCPEQRTILPREPFRLENHPGREVTRHGINHD